MALCAAVVTSSLVTAASASADDSIYTRQAQAINGEFLRDLPAPTGGAAAICVIDSGINLNTDLEQSVTYRYALDGGSLDDLSSTLHGTRVAAFAAAAQNGWGSVGTWPAAQIISVRATTSSDYDSYPEDRYVEAMLACHEAAQDRGLNLVAINLSLGDQVTTMLSLVEEIITTVRGAYGISVVVAAGNQGASEVDYPARFEDALAVGGISSETGEFCASSNRGEGLDLSAPGCELDSADPTTGSTITSDQGTSFAAPQVAATLAALRSYRPDLSVEEAEALLLANAETTSSGKVLDAEDTFRAAGLGDLVDSYVPSDEGASNTTDGDAQDGQSGATGASSETTTAASTAIDATTATAAASVASTANGTSSAISDVARSRLKRPRVISAYRTQRRLYLWLARVPKGATVVIKIGSKTLRFRRALLKDNLITLTMRRWRSVRVRFRDSTGTKTPSRWFTLRPVGITRRL